MKEHVIMETHSAPGLNVYERSQHILVRKTTISRKTGENT
jgi:hypothetical protein